MTDLASPDFTGSGLADDSAPGARATQHPRYADLLAMTRRTVAHALADTVSLADDVVTVPAKNYYDADRWHEEMAKLFRRVPLVAAFSCEFAEVGSYRAFDLVDVPIIVIRGEDDVLRAFVNSCSHRGAQLVDGDGSTRRLTCPYHAWSYDPAGTLVGIRDRDDFGPVDAECSSLRELACAERAGIVWVSLASLNDQPEIAIDDWLCGYDEYLDALGIASAVPVARQEVEGPNWKLAYDGYLDFYHLPILHKNTFGPDYGNKAIYDSWGPHQRVSSPDQRSADLAKFEESAWTLRQLTTGVWTIFPHVSIARFDAGVPLFMISQLMPGDEVGTSVTTQHFLAAEDPSEHLETIAKQMEFLKHVVRDEDYFTGIRIGRALATGAKTHVMFGRNEEGGQNFHGWVDRLLAASSNTDASETLRAATTRIAT